MFGAFNTSSNFGWITSLNKPTSGVPLGPPPQLYEICTCENSRCVGCAEGYPGVVCPQAHIYPVGRADECCKHISIRLIHTSFQLLDQGRDARICTKVDRWEDWAQSPLEQSERYASTGFHLRNALRIGWLHPCHPIPSPRQTTLANWMGSEPRDRCMDSSHPIRQPNPCRIRNEMGIWSNVIILQLLNGEIRVCWICPVIARTRSQRTDP